MHSPASVYLAPGRAEEMSSAKLGGGQAEGEILPGVRIWAGDASVCDQKYIRSG